MADYIYIACSLVLAGLVLWWDIHSDYKDWQKNKPINHNNQGFKRLMLLTPSIIILSIPIVEIGTDFWMILLNIVMCTIVCAGCICFPYWVLFDGLYSNKRRFNFWDLGSDGDEDGKADNFLQSLTKFQHIAIKIGGSILFITAYILLLI